MALSTNAKNPDGSAATAGSTYNGWDQPSGTTGANDPQKNLYQGYRDTVGTATTTTRTDALLNSLQQNVFDPWGLGGEARTYTNHGWINPYGAENAAYQSDGLFKYNQFLMTTAQNFDPFMQKKEMEHPHWWLNRVPRTAYKLFDGSVHETRIYRGGLSVYAGLSDWEDINPDPTKADPCGPVKGKTYSYAWEARAWSGKKTAWMSDPICLDMFKFVPQALEQLGWILETGVKFGTDIQNIWNRDMFIFHSVMAGRSYIMTSQYRGADSPRYVYDPFVKFAAKASEATHTASTSYVDKPFIVFSAEADVEPLNFDVLDIYRKQLERNCPEAAIGSIGGSRMYALAVSEDDVEKYIRGNEEERRYWIEANPQALINHYGFAPTTFRRWTITCDGDQLRFKLKRYIPSYTATEAANYGGVGKKEFLNKPVYIAEFVAPEYASHTGINGGAIPEANPEYDLAELAIAPIFMNQVFTNQFVPDVTTLGHGTYFGPKQGLNGKWAWYNIQTPENPDRKIGNFKGEYEIVPKPENCAVYASSFLYRRCAEPLRSLCPAENPKINVNAKTTATITNVATPVESTIAAYDVGTLKGIKLMTTQVTLSDNLLGFGIGDTFEVVSGTDANKVVLTCVVLSEDSTVRYTVQATVKEAGTSFKTFTGTNLVAALKGASITVG